MPSLSDSAASSYADGAVPTLFDVDGLRPADPSPQVADASPHAVDEAAPSAFEVALPFDEEEVEAEMASVDDTVVLAALDDAALNDAALAAIAAAASVLDRPRGYPEVVVAEVAAAEVAGAEVAAVEVAAVEVAGVEVAAAEVAGAEVAAVEVAAFEVAEVEVAAIGTAVVAVIAPSMVDTALDLFRANYVFPEKAKAAAEVIKVRHQSGAYADLSEEELAERLTAELFELCADKHLRVRIRSADLQAAGTTKEAAELAWREYLRTTNYRISRVERLEGNIGYLDLRGVPSPADGGGRAIAAAMELVSQTEALIIDLRKNRGGSPDGVIFWCSYFFPDEETHLNSIFDATTGQTKQYWSLAYVPGPRYLDRPVFVLISDMTFSAGEELCYNLQAQQRAILIGQTTRGGAHPTDSFPISDTVEITVPSARSINPITGTNWEGVGVKPDIKVPAEQALRVAYERALDHVIATTTTAAIREEAQATRSGLV